MIQGSLLDAMERREDFHWTPSDPPSLDGIDEITVDAETQGLRWWRGHKMVGFGIGYKRGDQYITQYLPFAHEGGGNLDEAVLKRWAKKELRGKKIKNLNSRFDNHNFYNWGVDLEEQGCVWGDIGHYMGLLHDQRRRGFSLEAISQELIGRGKIKGLDGSRISKYHAGEVAAYACMDVELVLRDMDVLRPQLAARKLERVAALEDEIIYAVCEMERNGAPIDIEKLGQWIKMADEELVKTIWALHKLIGFRVEPKNNDDMVRLFRIRGIELKHFTQNGQPSFTDEILAGIKDEAVELVRYARKLKSLDSKYLRCYHEDLRGGNILRYALNQLKSDEGGTISGRFSSSSIVDDYDGQGGEGVNIQQVMRPGKQKELFGDRFNIRELFVPGAGFWLSADAKQIEYRLFAHYSGSKRLWVAYEKDPETDFHNTVWEILKTFDSSIDRKLTKDTNFAKIYGAQVNRIAKMLRMPRDRAEQFVETYDTMFPETKQLIKKVMKLAEDRGYVKTILGRRFYFPDGQFLHKALSRVIQGTAADIMKTKLNELHKARKKTGFKMRFTVHDEVNGDAPDYASIKMVAAILNAQSIPFKVPILWDVSFGPNWGTKTWKEDEYYGTVEDPTRGGRSR